MGTLKNASEENLQKIRKKVYEMPYRTFSNNIVHKIIQSAEFEKLFQRGVENLSLEEKDHLAEMIVKTLGDETLIINNNALIVFMAAVVVRMASHQ